MSITTSTFKKEELQNEMNVDYEIINLEKTLEAIHNKIKKIRFDDNDSTDPKYYDESQVSVY